MYTIYIKCEIMIVSSHIAVLSEIQKPLGYQNLWITAGLLFRVAVVAVTAREAMRVHPMLHAGLSSRLFQPLAYAACVPEIPMNSEFWSIDMERSSLIDLLRV